MRSFNPSIDDGWDLLWIVAFTVFGLVILPVLVFGIGLVVGGCVIAGGVIGTTLLGRPWVIEAKKVTGPGSPLVLEREVAGWRGSRAAVRQLRAEIEAGRDPATIPLHP